MKTNQLLRRCSILALAAASCTLIGCSSSDNSRHAGDINMIRSDPSPALSTLSRRSTDRYNDIYGSIDTNRRMITNDIDKHILFLDHPSHLTSFPSRR